jgi:hypothetical protein
MPLLFVISAAGTRRYLRNTPAGVVFTDRFDEADDVRIETPYSPAPLTLAAAATMTTPVVLLFPSAEGPAPMYPISNTEGSPLSASRTEASQIFRRWTIRPAPAGGYFICLSITPAFGVGASDETSDPILTVDRIPVFEEDADGDFCESCDIPVEKGTRWCSFGCRCDVEPDYVRSHSRW